MRLAPCGARIARRVGPRSPAIQVILFPVPEAHDQEASGGSCSQVASARTTTPAANGVAHQQRDAAAGTPLSCDTARSRDRLRPASSPPPPPFPRRAPEIPSLAPISRVGPKRSGHQLSANARCAAARVRAPLQRLRVHLFEGLFEGLVAIAAARVAVALLPHCALALRALALAGL